MINGSEHGQWLGVAEAAQFLRIPERTLSQYLREGKYSSKIQSGDRYVYLKPMDLNGTTPPPHNGNGHNGHNRHNGGSNDVSTLNYLVTVLKEQLAEKDLLLAETRAQLKKKDHLLADTERRFNHLMDEFSDFRRANHEASKAHDGVVSTLAQQIERLTHEVEAMKSQPGFWQRIFRKD